MPVCDKSANDRKIETDKNIKEKIGEIQNTSVGESAFFKEDERESGAGYIVGAEIHPENRGQAAVGE